MAASRGTRAMASRRPLYECPLCGTRSHREIRSTGRARGRHYCDPRRLARRKGFAGAGRRAWLRGFAEAQFMDVIGRLRPVRPDQHVPVYV